MEQASATAAPVIVEQVYPASAGTIWNALTEPDKMKQWYFDIPGFTPSVGTEYKFYAGDENHKWLHHWKISEVIPHKKIEYTWTYPGYAGISRVSFELFPEGNKTRLKLIHQGLESFAATPDLARNNFVDGWTEIMTGNLPRFLNKD